MGIYTNSVVYGPYKRQDGRLIVIVRKNGINTTVSYPRYLVEVARGKLLKPYEVVHHINGDPTDNRLENLQVVDQIIHKRTHQTKYKDQEFSCPVCKKQFKISGPRLSKIMVQRRSGNTKSGPYCSKQCAGTGSNIMAKIKVSKF